MITLHFLPPVDKLAASALKEMYGNIRRINTHRGQFSLES